jgi:hypothetical protein
MATPISIIGTTIQPASRIGWSPAGSAPVTGSTSQGNRRVMKVALSFWMPLQRSSPTRTTRQAARVSPGSRATASAASIATYW